MHVSRVSVKRADSTPPPRRQRMQLARLSFDRHLRSAELLQETKAGTQAASAPTHIVRHGETLSGICMKFLKKQNGDVSAQSIYDAVATVARDNGISNPNLIMPGEHINLASIAKSQNAATAQTASAKAQESVPPLVPGRDLSLSSLTAMMDPVFSRASQSPVRVLPLGGPVNKLDVLPAVLDPVESTPADSPSPWSAVLDGAGALTSPFGPRKDPFTGAPDFHKGVDIAAPKGTEIKSLMAGKVTYSGWKPGYGNVVIVRHANGLETRYGHTEKNLVHTGDTVRAGTALGLVGNTGRSTGPHLHFELRRNGRAVNPVPMLEKESLQIAEAL